MQQLRTRAALAAVLLAVACGVAVRALAARGDLWLDELWSVNLARAAGGPAGVFLRLHHDNNHHLNTLWIQLVGGGAPALALRALAVGGAAALLALLALRTWREGPATAVATTVLAAGSFLLVQYGSEARGYGPALALAVAAYLALERYLATLRRRWAACFAAAGALGILAHLSFVLVLGAAAPWVVLELVRAWRRAGWRASWAGAARIAPGLALLLVPAAVLGALWWVDLRVLRLGGAGGFETTAVVRQLAQATLGLAPGWRELLAIPVALAAILELALMARARDGRALFLGLTLLLPAAALLARPPALAPRFFAVAVPFLFLLLGGALGRLARAWRPGGWVVAAALLAFLAGNAPAVAGLIAVGRGQYTRAVALIVGSSPPGKITVGSDHPFRNGMVLEETARRMGVLDRLVHVGRGPVPPPEWYLVHAFDPRAQGNEAFVRGGRLYRRAGVYPYSGLSGFTWIVYRRVPAAAPPGPGR